MKVLKDTFSAWIDKQPGGPNKFIARSKFRTGGWQVTIRTCRLNPATL